MKISAAFLSWIGSVHNIVVAGATTNGLDNVTMREVPGSDGASVWLTFTLPANMRDGLSPSAVIHTLNGQFAAADRRVENDADGSVARIHVKLNLKALRKKYVQDPFVNRVLDTFRDYNSDHNVDLGDECDLWHSRDDQPRAFLRFDIPEAVNIEAARRELERAGLITRDKPEEKRLYVDVSEPLSSKSDR